MVSFAYDQSSYRLCGNRIIHLIRNYRQSFIWRLQFNLKLYDSICGFIACDNWRIFPILINPLHTLTICISGLTRVHMCAVVIIRISDHGICSTQITMRLFVFASLDGWVDGCSLWKKNRNRNASLERKCAGRYDFHDDDWWLWWWSVMMCHIIPNWPYTRSHHYGIEE